MKAAAKAATIDMPSWAARDKIREYAASIKANPKDPVLRTAMATFRALARRKRVVDVAVAIAGGGVDQRGFPKLALAQADWSDVWCEARQWIEDLRLVQRLYFSRNRNFTIRGKAVGGREASRIEIPGGRIGTLNTKERARARVPIIPAPLRPPSQDLGRYAILFEAEWNYTEPIDPLLLRHLGGTLFVVLAAWDLTPAEAAIFSGARSS